MCGDIEDENNHCQLQQGFHLKGTERTVYSGLGERQRPLRVLGHLVGDRIGLEAGCRCCPLTTLQDGLALQRTCTLGFIEIPASTNNTRLQRLLTWRREGTQINTE